MTIFARLMPAVSRCAALLLLTPFLCGGSAAGGEFATIALSNTADPLDASYGNALYVLGLGEDKTVIFHSYPFLSQSAYIYFRKPNLPGKRIGIYTITPEHGVIERINEINVNSSGDVAFSADLFLSTNIYAFFKGKFRTVIQEGKPAADDGVFKYGGLKGRPAISEKGLVAFHGLTSDSGEGIFLANPAATSYTLSRIAKVGDNSLDSGHFTKFDNLVAVTAPARGPALVLFYGITNGTAGQAAYLGSSSKIKLLAPGNPPVHLNNSGQAVLYKDEDIFLATMTSSSIVIGHEDSVPDLGTFTSLSNPTINDRGEIAFAATYEDYNGRYHSGIFLRDSAGVIKTVALVPPGGGTFYHFSEPDLNNAGLVMFTAEVQVNNQLFHGIFLGDGMDLVRVVQTGDFLLGMVIDPEGYFDGASPSPAKPGLLPGNGSFNVHGQVAFRAKLRGDTSGIFLYTPSVHWRTPGSGLWDEAANWIFGLKPAQGLDAAIDPAVDSVIQGPAATTAMRSLQIGGGGGLAKLVLQQSGGITSSNGVIVTDRGVLGGKGTIGSRVTLQDGSAVELELGGRVRGTGYQFLNFAGPVAFGGNLNVTTVNGFIPLLGDSFDLFNFSAHTGAFANVTLPALSSKALQWDKSQLTTTGRIGVALVNSLKGAYAGRIVADAVENYGSFSLFVLPNGAFRAKGILGMKNFAFAGVLDSAGAFTSRSIDTAGHIVKFKLDLTNPAAGAVTGSVQSATAVVANVTAQKTPVFIAKAPSPYKGAYTLALPADPAHPEAAFPQGTGYATLTVSATGRYRLAGVLGDGTPISSGGMISTQGQLALFAPLYKQGGFLTGQLVLTGPLSANELTGSLHWSKPVSEDDKPYPAAFVGDLTIIGSGFEAAPHPILSFPNGGILTVTGGNLQTVFTPASFTIDTQRHNAVTFASSEPTLVFSKSTFSGSFPATVDGEVKTMKFKGVVLQKQNIARGLFTGIGQNGSASLDAKP